ncbi:MAG: CDP-alcohol phosphatidyltransferase family protein [Janthinobacterium lividum]
MPPKPRTWDARLARQMILPLVSTPVTPNHLTTVRLIVGLACAWAFALGSYGWTNLGALLLVLSNVIDHADGELARMSGKSSRFGHFYDLAADSLVTVLLFVGIGAGVAQAAFASAHTGAPLAPSFASNFLHYATAAGTLAGISVAAIFFMRMRIEEIAGKAGTAQPSWGGFELEDILYLMPLVTLFNGLQTFLMLAVIGAPAFALWITIDYFRVTRRRDAHAAAVSKTPSRP